MIDACEAVLQRVPVIIVQVFHQPVYFPRQEQMEIILIYRNHIISIWHFNILLQKYIIPKILRNLLLNIWAGIASRACALRNFFPRKTFQPVTISVIYLYVRRLHSDGFGAQTRH